MFSFSLSQLEKKPIPRKKGPLRIRIPVVEKKKVDVDSDGEKEKDEKNDEQKKRELLTSIQGRLIVQRKRDLPLQQEVIEDIPEVVMIAPPIRPIKKKMILKPMEEQDQKEESKEETKEDIDEETKEESIVKKPIMVNVKRPRITKKPELKKKEVVIPEKLVSEPTDMQMEIEDVDKRLPVKKPNVLIRAPAYYMNNREIFVNSINTMFHQYKKELKTSESQLSCDKKGDQAREFSLLTHQKIVRDYLNLYTPYRGLLLYHGLGSGKTCSSIAIAEGMKNAKKVVIMIPASLRTNYIEELKKCGDPIYRRNQFWEFISIRRHPELEDSLSKALSLSIEYIRKMGGAWLVNVNNPPNYEQMNVEQKRALDDQINEMILKKYQFINYNGMQKEHLKSLSSNYSINPFDNKVIVVDEVHNLVSRIVNKINERNSLSMRLYDYLMTAKNARLVFLSGTPIINYPNEIGILLNMLRGYIHTWTFKINVSGQRKIDKDVLSKMLRKIGMVDYLDYNSNEKKITLTRNPFGFFNIKHKKGRYSYKGVELDENGKLNDSGFVKVVTETLMNNRIQVVSNGVVTNAYKAFPDKLDDFKTFFIDSNNKLVNTEMFKRRAIGLTSYYRSAQEQLMPRFDLNQNFHVVKIDMSLYQFNIYKEVRNKEIEKQKKQAKRKKIMRGNGSYEELGTSTYRIFSRAFCNFVFPETDIVRPMPKEKENVVMVVDNVENAEPLVVENIMDGVSIDNIAKEEDQLIDMDDIEKLREQQKENMDISYEKRIRDALRELKKRESEFLTPDALAIYSPKFLNILENIQDEDHKGLHLVYSQFRTLEGIGILKLVLEANGFAQFRIQKNGSGVWKLAIPDKDKGKPTFVLYTGTESREEKEIVRNIFNGTWENVPSTIVEDLEKISTNNLYGEVIKVFMITSSGAEGISLKNVRYVHITEPYWHPVRMQQVIGRARRICSHQDLPENERTVDVFLYLMQFTEEILRSDESILIRDNDKSKLDDVSIVTSDEALYEISTIKEMVNKQILDAIKESSMDCVLHKKGKSGESLKCLTFGKVTSKRFSYKPSIENEESDKMAELNKQKVVWKAMKQIIGGVYYAVRVVKDGPNEVYDLDSYNEGEPILIGYIKKVGKNYRLEFVNRE